MPRFFPDPRHAGPDGIVAFCDDLSPERLVDAYRNGIFPWPVEELPLPWFCPAKRAILEASRFHVGESIEREIRRARFRFTVDTAFPEVIARCAAMPRAGQRGTWITPAIESAYQELHRLGYAHSVEAWLGDRLAGGLYGVEVDGVFAGESMFHEVSGASKLALVWVCRALFAAGAEWVDVQMRTPLLQRLGAREVRRGIFLSMLEGAQRPGLSRFALLQSA